MTRAHSQEPITDTEDQMVAAERSMFGTRLPRPTGVGRHLVVVLVVSVLALGLAVAFAERADPAVFPAASASPAPAPPR